MTHAPASPRVSVVVATYNRLALLERLLRQLADQTLPSADYEVVVVDDGSAQPVRPALAGLALPYSLRIEAQANAGAAAARHAGALLARGEVMVIVDDDMQVGRDFLEQHLRAHAPGASRVVLGRIRPDPGAPGAPLFERWHQWLLDRMAEDARAGRVPLQGNLLFTGNVSMRRADYLAVGGFDRSLGCSEDAELGLRLEKAGATFVFCEEAATLNNSDHTSLAKWRGRAERYGVHELRIAARYPDAPHANPWRYLFRLNRLSRPLFAAALVAPRAMRPVGGAAYALASALDRLGLQGAALRGTTLVYGLDYFRGLRTEAGSLGATLSGLAAYARTHAGLPRRSLAARLALVPRLLEEVRADHESVRRSETKYGHRSPASGALARDLVEKVGLQLTAGYRLMRLLRDAELPLAAKVTSRLLRHLYGSDIHWDATLEPGLTVVHGMGLAISHAAHVGKGCILFQHVTLGLGTHPVTRESGAPTLEDNVHIGPGATLLGPITVGEGSKVMAGVVLTDSVPPGCVVEAPQPGVRPRTSGGEPARPAPGMERPRRVS